MGLLESVTKAISNMPGNLTSALAAEFYPETLSGFLNEYLNGVSAKEFYHKVKETSGKSLLSYLDKGAQARLKGITPEDLSWLTLEWFVRAIYEEHPDIGNLILSSEYVKKEVERQIELFKEECAK